MIYLKLKKNYLKLKTFKWQTRYFYHTERSKEVFGLIIIINDFDYFIIQFQFFFFGLRKNQTQSVWCTPNSNNRLGRQFLRYLFILSIKCLLFPWFRLICFQILNIVLLGVHLLNFCSIVFFYTIFVKI